MQYTLHETASMLGVEQKTLRKWVKDSGIEPVPDDVDQRRRLLDDQQIEILRNRYRRNARKQDDLVMMLHSMQQQVDALTHAITSLQAKIDPQ